MYSTNEVLLAAKAACEHERELYILELKKTLDGTYDQSAHRDVAHVRAVLNEIARYDEMLVVINNVDAL